MAAIDERVEYPDFDLRMRGQRSDLLVAVDRVTVVDQQPHAHAAVGGAQQRIGQQLAGFILAENEVFEIDRPLGGV